MSGSNVLNADQRRAVEHGYHDEGGPLVVLAGPGAGKTRVIVERIAHLIGERGARPESIVAVTFTVKAAGQLRDRLAGRVGPSAAQRVNAGTFHALALKILRRFPDLLELGPAGASGGRAWGVIPGGEFGLGGAALIDSAQRKRLLRAVILERGLFEGARGVGFDLLAAKVERVGDWLANRGIEGDGRAELLRAELARVASGRGAWGEPLEAGASAAAAERCERLAQVFAALDGFEQARWSRGLVSFDDLIVLATRVATSPAAARILHDDIRHVVVDEWQDVNAAQVGFLRALAPPRSAAGRRPDLCVVGDDDQAIFAFRGANERAFELFERVWGEPNSDGRGVAVVRLGINYRSRPGIIEAGNFQLARLNHRFDREKRIAPAEPSQEGEGREEGEAGPPVECILHGAGMESGVIAALILADRARAERSGAPRSWSTYAVLTRSNSTAQQVAAVLRLEGIAALAERGGGLLGDDGVQDVLAWAELLVAPPSAGSATPGVRVLTRPPLGVPALTAMAWARGYAAEVRALEESGAGGGRRGDARSPERTRSIPTFVEYCLGAAAGSDNEASVRRFDELYRALAEGVAREPAASAIERIARETDAAHAEPLEGRKRAARVAALVALVRLARQVQPRLSWAPGEQGGLRELVGYVRELDDDDALLKGTDPDDVLGGSGYEGQGEPDQSDVVQVITAHKAKGLEWHTVFVARAEPSGGFGQQKAREWDELITPELDLLAAQMSGELATTDTSGAKGDEAAERIADEERRLFYVALTRARDRLVVLARERKTKSKSVRYLEEMVEGLCGSVAGDGRAAVVVRSVEDVREECVTAGVSDERLGWLLAGTEGDESADGAIGGVGGGTASERVFEQERAAARRAAGEAVDRGLHPGLDGAAVAQAAARASDAVRRAAVIAHVQRAGELPGWLAGESGDLRGFGERLIARVRAGAAKARDGRGGEPGRSSDAEGGAGGGAAVAPQRPPLRLSYTMIEQYGRCAGCYGVKYVLGLAEPQTPRLALGVAAHRALERYFREVRDADAESRGGEVGLDRLLALGREAFSACAPWEGREAGGDERVERRAELEQLLDQLRMVHGRLHRAEDEILELEWSSTFEYPLPDPREAGVVHAHVMTAKIDRIDRGAEGAESGVGIRIIDYKTGAAKAKILEPARDDLQMGIYAMAAERAYGHESVWVHGEAEYWALSTGQRGRIALSTLDRGKIERKIRAAVDGMLLGRFERKKGCDGPCWLLGEQRLVTAAAYAEQPSTVSG